MSILPAQFDRVVPYRTDRHQFRVGHVDETALRAMALAKRAGTGAAQVNFIILAGMTVIPSDAHDVTRSYMIDFSGV